MLRHLRDANASIHDRDALMTVQAPLPPPPSPPWLAIHARGQLCTSVCSIVCAQAGARPEGDAAGHGCLRCTFSVSL